MTGDSLHRLVERQALSRPGAIALRCGEEALGYATLWERICETAGRLQALGLQPGDRVAVWLPKTLDHVVTAFATLAAGGVFVPVNPVLKAAQVMHILRNSGARILVSNADRLVGLEPEIGRQEPSPIQVTVDRPPSGSTARSLDQVTIETGYGTPSERGSSDLAALFYTSGSTGRPKGVMVSHDNLCLGAASVAEYLQNTAEDRILAVLPFSFDYGFSQLTTAFHTGASVVLLEYLLPGQVIQAVERFGITGLAGVPSLWNRLAPLDWPEGARRSLRYITNSGGTLPRSTLTRLREALPETEVFLMYGLTEAFRSTYLPPSLLDAHPDSVGRPVPHAEIHVVRPDGSECEPGEKGELVHVGPLVAQGYWQDPETTAQMFRPWSDGRPAVWSGDRMVRDAEGLLYFRGRSDGLIKTSGYRVSPEEIEEQALACPGVRQALAVGLPDAVRGQRIALAFEGECEPETLRRHLADRLPNFMLPDTVVPYDRLPLTPHGKPDRIRLRKLLEASS